MLFEGQGKVFSATRLASGYPRAMRYLGDVSMLQTQVKTQTVEHQESHTGQRLTDAHIVTSKQMDVTVTMDEWLADNLALALYGTYSQVTSGTVTAEQLPSNLAQGDYARLAHPKVSSVVIKDSAGTPATLTAGTDYEVESANHGTIKILGDLSGYTQPLTADYSYAQYDRVVAFDQDPGELWLRFEGLNIADDDAPVLVELYKVRLEPVQQMDLINNQLSQLQLQGQALYDSLHDGDATLGQFGRILQL
ncbi:MAG TPA: hypothetical protein VKA32_04420 [Gammaproteobacteria bacterium]|nr:hypothetical protein [Gammaproteobacteria bacterium]